MIDLLPSITATSGLKATYSAPDEAARVAEVAGAAEAPLARAGGGAGAAAELAQRPAAAACGRRRSRGGGGAPASSSFGTGNRGGGSWPNFYTAAAEICMWDTSGQGRQPADLQAAGRHERPDDGLRQLAASRQPGGLRRRRAQPRKSRAIKATRSTPAAASTRPGRPSRPMSATSRRSSESARPWATSFILAHDPVQRYNLFEALKVGRLLDELDYAWFEDPIRTVDIDGLVELNRGARPAAPCRRIPYSISDFAEYIRRGALDVARLIADNVGGIGGSMRVGMLADAFNLECTPHNWGNPTDLAVHFHLELALPNAYWFEMPHPASYADRPYQAQVPHRQRQLRSCAHGAGTGLPDRSQ